MFDSDSKNEIVGSYKTNCTPISLFNTDYKLIA